MSYSTLEVIKFPVAIFDPHGRIKFENLKFREIKNLKCVDELECTQSNMDLGTFLLKLFSGLYTDSNDLKKANPDHRFIVSASNEKNAVIYFEVEFTSIKHDKDLEVICVLQDITQHKLLESELDKKEEFLWLLMFSLPIGLIFVNSNSYTIEDLNLEAANMLGAEREAFLNKKCYHFFPCEKKDCPVNRNNLLRVQEETVLLRPDGTSLPVIKTIKKLPYGGSDIIMVALVDVSERKKLMERLKELSITDALTGLYNRRYFVEKLKDEIDRSRRYGDEFTIIMLDLDHFKSINDTFGHSKGDEVLVGTASAIKARLRCTDVFARWGGEEFIILLPSTALEGAITLAEELREILAQQEYQIGRPVTASFGVAPYLDGDSPDQLIVRADSLLYKAKGAGRNCVVAFQVDSKEEDF